MRPTYWHQNFGPNGLSAPAQRLCLNVFSSVTADFNISSAIRWAIQDQWSSGYLFPWHFRKNDGPWNSLPLCFGVMKKWWSLKFITPEFWGHEKIMVPEIHYPCVLGSWKNDGPWNPLPLCFGVMKKWWSLKFITPVFWGHEKMMVPEIHYPCVLGSWKTDDPWNSLPLCFGVMKKSLPFWYTVWFFACCIWPGEY